MPTPDEQGKPPRDFPLNDYAVTRSVGALLAWGGGRWRWDGRDWKPIEVTGLPDQATPADEDDEHGPWNYTEYGTLCFCGYPVDSDERCTRPRTLRGQLDALTGKLFEAADNLLTEFDRAGRTDGVIESSMDDLRAARDELSEFWETNRAALAGNTTEEPQP